MNSYKGLLKPNERILVGTGWIIIALLYLFDRVKNNVGFRIIDWLAVVGMFLMGTISIIEGVQMKRNNSK